MTRLKLSVLLLGATALTLPGSAAFAQQAQQGQQGQQVAQQGEELGACERLLRLVEEASGEQLLAEFERAPEVAEGGDAEACALIVTQVEQAGGISEEAVAEGRGVQFLTETETFSDRERITETVQIEQQAIVEGEVLVRQPIPEIGVEQAGPEIGVAPGPVDVEIQEQAAEIVIRQAPANVRVQIPEPTITIEQPAPEIVLHMPPPGVSLDQQAPQVSVEMPDPNVTVAQGDPQVTANVEARFVDDAEMAELDQQRGDEPMVRTVTERLDAAGNPVDEQKRAEVTVRKGEPRVLVQRSEQQGDVRFRRAEPRISFEQAEPNVEVAFAESANVQIQRVGEPTVRIERGEQQQASAQGQQQAEGQQQVQGQQQATMQQQRAASDGGAGMQIDQRIQAANQALEAEDIETARAEVDAANQELAMAMEQAGDEQRQQLQGLGDQLALVIVALDQQDLESARTALGDAETMVAENGDQWFAETDAPVLEEDQAALEQGEAEAGRLSIEDTNRLLATEEGMDFGEAQVMDIRAGDLRGADVMTVRGEEVGEIEQIASSGGQLYAIIEHGGFLGIGEDHVAIPLERIAMRGNEVILLGLTEQQLEQMPNYDFQSDQEFSANDTIEIGRFE